MEFDEMRHVIGSKKNKCGVIKAVDRLAGQTVTWVLSSRGVATFKRLHAKVEHLKGCIFYNDTRDAFAKAPPKNRHIIGKRHMVVIERDNSNTRHHQGRMARGTKVGSKKRHGPRFTQALVRACHSGCLYSVSKSIFIYL